MAPGNVTEAPSGGPFLANVNETDDLDERTPLHWAAKAGNAKNSISKCGIFDTGFAGTFYDVAHWRSVLEVTAGGGGNFSTAPLLWPVLYLRGSWE